MNDSTFSYVSVYINVPVTWHSSFSPNSLTKTSKKSKLMKNEWMFVSFVHTLNTKANEIVYDKISLKLITLRDSVLVYYKYCKKRGRKRSV